MEEQKVNWYRSEKIVPPEKGTSLKEKNVRE